MTDTLIEQIKAYIPKPACSGNAAVLLNSSIQAIINLTAENERLRRVAIDLQDEIDELTAERDALREAFARQLYEPKTANHATIHCNRFSTWDQLSDETKAPYRDQAALKGQDHD